MSGRTPSLGSLNQRIELLSRAISTDTSGGQSTTYTSLGFVWAKVQTSSSGVSELGDGFAALQPKQITMRFRTDIKPGDRIVIGGQQFDVENVADINGRQAYLDCWCTAPTMIGSRYE